MRLGSIPAMAQASNPHSMARSARRGAAALLTALLWSGAAGAADGLQYWRVEFPETDFAKHAVPFAEVRSDGGRRDAIPAIANPLFIPAAKLRGMGPDEPVLSLEIGADARAYPLRLLVWHEVVHDRVAETPLLVTYAPLVNSAVVYERLVETPAGRRKLTFANTGRVRHFDTLIYDRETHSWWQQATGAAVIGVLTGTRLKALPTRVESFRRFVARHPDGRVLVPSQPKFRPYGATPYVGMDTSPGAGLEGYALPDGVKPYDRVVAVDGRAWTLAALRAKGTIRADGLTLSWVPGQNAVHDAKWIAFGRDVGNVIVRRLDPETELWGDAHHDLPFAFAFRAFHPTGALVHEPPPPKKDKDG